ncbi:cyclic nucleotide-binding domain-containing protein [Desulfosediminicola flagellatus]|uniref:cyclic nucleotide-binding domain-containing protein n=1 Tax=Desulfosediminicola flagellatus TaxID=2569541 RepID=UPI0010AD14DC|nr:cyclic nucleotide-binding domain-containing protein [Desulfosediminicola flagellatus]
MEIDRKRQAEAQLKVKELLEITEIQRDRKRAISGIEAISSGKYSVLENEDFFRNIPYFIFKTPEGAKYLHSPEFIVGLNDSAVDKNKNLRSRAVTLLSFILDWAEANSEKEVQRRVITSLFSWMVTEDELVDGYEIIIRQLEKRCLEVLAAFEWDDAQIYLSLFSVVANDKNRMTQVIRSVASRTLWNIGNVTVLNSLFSSLFESDEIEIRNIEKCIVCLGKNAMLYGLGFLAQVEVPEQKEQLIDFFARAGDVAVDAIQASNLSFAPAHVFVSMIRIIKKMRKDAYFEIIAPFLKSGDIQVQHEVLKFILAGDETKVVSRLIEAGSVIRPELKPDLIKQLSVFSDPNIEKYLYDTLSGIVSQPVCESHTLISALVVSFKNYPDQKNINLLKSCLIYLSESGGTEKIVYLVDETIRDLKSKIRHKRRLQNEPEGVVSFDLDPVGDRDELTGLNDFINDLNKIVKDGFVSKALRMLTGKAIWYAGEKDFQRAECLRDMILSLDQAAIEELFRVENEIEEQRKTAVPESFRKLWGTLSETLGEDQFEQFFLALNHEQFYSGEEIEAEGDRNDTLYFIKSGSVSLSYDSSGTDVFVKRLKTGSVIGYDVFFRISIWTLTVKAEVETELFSLEKSSLKRLEENFPGIRDELQRFCDENNFSSSIFDIQRQDRRNTYRRIADKEMKIQLLDMYGDRGGRSIRCKLRDISTGGFSYTIRIAKHDNAAMLLGRKTRLISESNSLVKDEFEGDIVAVESLEVEEPYYKVCVKMLSPLKDTEITAMII